MTTRRKTKHTNMITIHSYDELPNFKSEDEEAQFWAAHTLDEELLDQMEPVPDGLLPPTRARTLPVSIRFDEHTIRRAKKLAEKRHTGYQTMFKQFIAERLYEEEKREGLV
jgi:hypothetical protein